MSSKKAYRVRELTDWQGKVYLYRCEPPMQEEPWDDEEPKSYEYVAASANVVMLSGPETYIFGTDAEGNVVDWGELPGSFRGALDPDGAVRNAGYEVVEAEPAESQP